jgi:spermidine synthase
MRLALAAVGFTSVIAQVVLIRELAAVFYGNELIFGLILAVWLLWVAAGAWGAGRPARRDAKALAAAALALLAFLLPLQIVLARALRLILGTTPGAYVGLGATAWSIALLLALPCLLFGAAFTLGARMLIDTGGTAGQAYAWESAGAVAGGALFSFLLVHTLNPFQIVLGLGAVNLLVVAGVISNWGRVLVGAASRRRLSSGNRQQELAPTKFAPEVRRTFTWVICGLAVLLLGLALATGQALNRGTLRWQWPDLVFARDTPYGRLAVSARDGQRVFLENGLLMFETQGTFPEEVAHFPLLEHPHPRRVLLIGGGVAGDLREVLKHPVEAVQYVELDPALIEAGRELLPPADAEVLADSRVSIAYMDGRLFVKEAGNRQSYDVVILDLPEPSTGQLNRFYTVEFFREVRQILKPGGVFSLGLPSAENYWSPELARRNASVYNALRAVFPSVVVLPGTHNFFLCSDRALSHDPALLSSRLQERGIGNRWVTDSYITYIFTTDRFAQVQQQLADEAGVKLNRDLAPVCYYYSMVLWLSLFYSGLGRFFYVPFLDSLLWLVVLAVLVAASLKLIRRATIPGVTALTGFAEMTLEVVILLAFQALHGYVYQQVSLLVAAFMAGLALGAILAGRLFGGASEDKITRGLRLTQAALAVTAFLLPSLLSLSLAGLLFPLLLVLIGVLGGLQFPLAVALSGGKPGQATGLIYGADLLGGCVGALLGGILLVPLLGVSGACYAVGLFCLAGLAALL